MTAALTGAGHPQAIARRTGPAELREVLAPIAQRLDRLERRFTELAGERAAEAQRAGD